MRYFITPHKYGKCYPLVGTNCWIECGEQVANYTHTLGFFFFPILISFWEEIGKSIKYIFDIEESLTPENILGINLSGKIKLADVSF